MATQQLCYFCNGEGYVSCDRCNGTGKVRGNFLDWNKYFECMRCHGTGKEECPICFGTMWIDVEEDDK